MSRRARRARIGRQPRGGAKVGGGDGETRALTREGEADEIHGVVETEDTGVDDEIVEERVVWPDVLDVLQVGGALAVLLPDARLGCLRRQLLAPRHVGDTRVKGRHDADVLDVAA